MARYISHAFGEATAAKYDFLRASAGNDGPSPVGVNRRHCRPLHPHGKRLVDAGLMRLVREGSKTSRHTALIITDDGLKELARLEKKLAKRDRKDADQRAGYGDLRPGSSRKEVRFKGFSPERKRNLKAMVDAYRRRAAAQRA